VNGRREHRDGVGGDCMALIARAPAAVPSAGDCTAAAGRSRRPMLSGPIALLSDPSSLGAPCT
jgi:hypothetical protein